MSEITELSSSIERVDVYRSQALVTRRAALANAGSDGQDVRLPGLPLLLRDDSVRVTVVDGGGRVVDLHVELRLQPRDTALRTDAEQNLKRLERERIELDVERGRLKEMIRQLEALTPLDVGATELPETVAFKPRDPVAGWLQLAGWVREETGKRQKDLRQLDRKRRELQDRIRAARAALEAESEAEAEALSVCRKAARLQLVGASGPVELEISYVVPACRWVPEYELRVESDSDEAELALKSLVAQQSGEDWPSVALSFSTADLMRSNELPELDSWRIGKRQPPKPSGWRELPDTLDELFEAYARGVHHVGGPDLPPAPKLPSPPRLGGEAPAHADRGDAALRLVAALERKAEMAPPAPPEPQAIAGELYQDEGDDEDYEEFEKEYDVEANSVEMAMLDEAPEEMMREEMSMPPPAPVMAKAAPRRSRSRGMKMKKSAAPPGFGSAAPMASMAVGGGGPGAVFDDEPTPPAGLEIAKEALTYGALRMVPANDPLRRGKLQAERAASTLRAQLHEVAPELAETLGEIDDETLAGLVRAEAPSLAYMSLPDHAVPVEVSAGHFATRYEMDATGAVPADGVLHALTLLRRRGAVKRVFRCVPSAKDSVYQVALFDNPLATPLLSGPVRVYKGGDFVVTAPLDTTPPGKTLTVNLGVEPSIKVARNTHFSESTSGLFGGGTVLHHTVTLEVRSRLTRPCQLELFERVPISHNDDIKVEIGKSTPKAESYDQVERGRMIRGGWRFRLELQPDEPQTCTLEYTITIPSKHVLVGGNRRD